LATVREAKLGWGDSVGVPDQLGTCSKSVQEAIIALAGMVAVEMRQNEESGQD
jgi:hypothetical protein